MTCKPKGGAGPAKMLTGIEGLDEITRGGLPRRRNTVVMGGPGCGKTIFALQSLVNGARACEPGIFVAFEENTRTIIENAATFGWDLPRLVKEKLFFLDARTTPDTATSGTFDLNGLLAALDMKIKEMGATRIVFDAIDVVLGLLRDSAAEQREIFRLNEWLQSRRITGIITSKIDDNNPEQRQRLGFLQFLGDCVILLNHRMAGRVSMRDLRVVKYRGSGFCENEVPMVIGPSGIEIGNISPDFPRKSVSNERVSTGVARLDDMLNGGYFRGSGVVITGAPGTAKTTLAGAFAAASCARGERSLFVSFDEEAPEIARNLSSVDLHLAPHLKSGMLRIYSARSEALSAEEHLLKLKMTIRDYAPSSVIVDPFSALMRAGGASVAQDVAERFLHLTTARNITTICTSLLDRAEPQNEASALQISTVADTWIHLSYSILGGERNRALTIVKSRGTKHSNQVRELILDDHGIDLTDVYTAGGEVLMGTLRWEKEAAEKIRQQRLAVEAKRKRRELELARSELALRLKAINRELELKEAELKLIDHEEDARKVAVTTARKEMIRHRGGLRLNGANDRPRKGRGGE